MSLRYPIKHLASLAVLALGAAVDASLVTVKAPFTGKITSVSYVPNGAVAGAANNNRTLSLKNRGQNGLGVTVPATLPLLAGVNLVAFDEKQIPLSATPGDLVVTEGDILTFETIHGGTGVADPGGLFIVEILAT